MLGSIAYLFGYLLEFWFKVVGNYGWAVILFSVTIKALLFPLTLKQQKTMKKNQELQPKLQALQEKYKDDQQKLSIEYQKFMKENKFSPFGGCLLMILQLFVLLGVLYVVTNPMKYMDKYTTEEINLALKEAIVSQEYSGDKKAFEAYAIKYVAENSEDKNVQKAAENTSGDSVTTYINYYKLVNRYHELTILKNKYEPERLTFFGISLSDITMQNPKNIKLWIFPILTTIFYYLSLWMVSKNQKKTPQKIKDAEGNEVEMPNMMTMNITMPLLSGWISASVPQGMGLYWFTNSFLQVIIQYVTDKFINKKDESSKPSDTIVEVKNLEKEENNEDTNTENSNEDPIKNDVKKPSKGGKNKNASKKKHKK